MISLRVFGTVVLALWAGAALAAGTLYDCQISKGGKAGTWISPRVGLVVRDGQPMAIDGVTLHFTGGPVTATVKRAGNELRFRWTVRGKDSLGESARFRYRAYLNTSTNQVRMLAQPSGYSNQFSGRGHCTARQNLSARQLQQALRGS